MEHVKLLAGIEQSLPPILVSRATKRIIDGTHRLHAAVIRGRSTIEVRFFDGCDEEAFVEAVRSNIAHGKPLTRKERQAAARRLLLIYPGRSDRALAEICGLSPKTVGKVRREVGVQTSERLGLDGKTRPIDTTTGRQRAAELLQASPDASVREIARQAGVSHATASDVRDRLSRGEPAYGRKPRFNSGHQQRRTPAPTSGANTPVEVSVIVSDAAFRSTTQGAEFADWLASHAIAESEWADFVEVIPLSRVYMVAQAARQLATAWHDFAETVEQKIDRRFA